MAVKLTRGVPWPVIWLTGAALEIAHINTGWTVIDEFAGRFVYFYSGYIFASHIFGFAALARLVAWVLVNGALVLAGTADRPYVSLPLGLVDAGAVVTVAALMARSDVFRPLRYSGQNSIVIYLAFFLPMAATHIALLKTGIVTDLGTVSLLVTLAGVIGALAWYWTVRGTPLRFLFERLAWAQIKPARAPAMQPAE